MTIHIPTHLQAYTGRAGEFAAEGDTLAAALADLDRRFPGFRFRIIDEQDAIRRHIKLFVNCEQVRTLAVPLQAGDQVHIIAALSGG